MISGTDTTLTVETVVDRDVEPTVFTTRFGAKPYIGARLRNGMYALYRDTRGGRMYPDRLVRDSISLAGDVVLIDDAEWDAPGLCLRGSAGHVTSDLIPEEWLPDDMAREVCLCVYCGKISDEPPRDLCRDCEYQLNFESYG